MFNKSVALMAVVCIFWNSGTCPAGPEDALLARFQNQNQNTAGKLKQEVLQNLAVAESPGQQDPVKLLERLRDNLKRLQDDSHLPRDERLALMSQLQDRIGTLKPIVAEKLRQENPEPLPEATASKETTEYPLQKQVRVKQWVPFPSTASMQVTPVVRPGRRWVRLGVSASFFTPMPGPLIPIQVPVPSIFFGPGPNVTVGTLRLNSAVSVPDGGTAIIGGSSTAWSGRNEFGAPVLGHLPYLGRGFRNIGTGRQIGSTSVGVSVRVISMEEEEQKLLAR